MLGTLLERGWAITDEPTEAQAIVVNTCGFIGSAKQESVDTILEAASLKAENPGLKVVVTGCLTQRYKGQLAKGLPEVDFFVGTDEFSRIGDLLEKNDQRVYAQRTHYLYNEYLPRVNTLGKFSAYVKVAEGCQHNCSFCIIPAIRGKLRSRPVTSVVAVVERLVETGVKEVNLIAQDLAAYGRDVSGVSSPDLLQLLRSLAAIDGLQWIRCLYVYPENISDEFLEFFANEPKLVKYLDIPVQHGSDRILKLMNRAVTADQLKEVFAKLRNRIPDMSLRTSVMVGFPDETEEDFLQLKSLIQSVRFDHLGCFKYSQEEGTVAGRMPNQIDDATKDRRYAEIMEMQRDISADRLASYVGRVVPVLVEGLSPETDLLYQGRLSTQAPEVDGVVYINDGPVKPGQIQYVEISESHDYDLVGAVVAHDVVH
jgi:ribosomal protein S12 methylthiotransferase